MTDEIKDAEVEEINPTVGGEATPAEKAKRAKTDFYIELVLFLILGVLIGVAVKTEASKRITIGYNDYQMKLGAQHYSINKLQTDLIEKQSSVATDEGGQETGEGGTCSASQ